jgi:hypothetical protein
MWSRNFRTKNWLSNKECVHRNSWQSAIHHSQKTETTQMPIQKWQNKNIIYHTVEYYLAVKSSRALRQTTTWMSAGNIFLSERCQTQRSRIIWFYWHAVVIRGCQGLGEGTVGTPAHLEWWQCLELQNGDTLNVFRDKIGNKCIKRN